MMDLPAMLSTIGYCCWFDIQTTSSLHPSKSIHWPTSLQGSLWVFLLEGVVKNPWSTHFQGFQGFWFKGSIYRKPPHRVPMNLSTNPVIREYSRIPICAIHVESCTVETSWKASRCSRLLFQEYPTSWEAGSELTCLGKFLFSALDYR